MHRATGRAPTSYERAAHWLPHASVLVPILATVLVLNARGWWPTNDDAFTAMAMRDTWTGHPRVMGPWASTVGFIGVYPHHPGPALYYVTSVGALPLGFSALGILVGVGLVNAITAAATVHIGHRLGGLPGAAAGAFSILVTALYIGSGLFFRPFNPFPPLLMILLMLYVATEFVGGRRDRWPVFALAGTIALQSHLSYAYLVVGLSIVLLLVGIFAWHRERDAWWPARGWLPHRVGRRRMTWPMRLCIVVAALLWLPVVIELLTYHPNNFTSVLDQMRIKAAPDVAPVDVDRFDVMARGMVPHAAGSAAELIVSVATAGLASIAVGHRALRAPRVVIMAARIGLLAVVLFAIQIQLVPHTSYFAEQWMVAAGAPVAAFGLVVLIVYAAAFLRWWVSHWPVWRRRQLTIGAATVVACALVGSAVAVVADATSTSNGEITVGQDVQAAERRIVDAMPQWPAADGSARPIAIHGSGLGPVFEISPSLGLALRNDGFGVFTPPAILGHDDTAFRSTDRAPAGAVRVLVIWMNQPVSERKVPETAETMGLVHQGENTFQIYLVPPED